MDLGWFGVSFCHILCNYAAIHFLVAFLNTAFVSANRVKILKHKHCNETWVYVSERIIKSAGPLTVLVRIRRLIF
jgi:hypothetical protein